MDNEPVSLDVAQERLKVKRAMDNCVTVIKNTDGFWSRLFGKNPEKITGGYVEVTSVDGNLTYRIKLRYDRPGAFSLVTSWRYHQYTNNIGMSTETQYNSLESAAKRLVQLAGVYKFNPTEFL